MFILTRLFRFLFPKTVSSQVHSTNQEQSLETKPLRVDDQELGNATTIKTCNDDEYDTASLPAKPLNYWIHRNRNMIDVKIALAERDDAFNADIYPKKTARFVLDEPQPTIEFPSKTFVLSGIFRQPREYYERDIKRRRGLIHKEVRQQTNYLVLGSVADRRWLYIIFGTKVDDAFECKKAGDTIAIISEEHLTSAIEATSPQTRGPDTVLGKYFFLTGRFKEINHEYASELIEQAGGHVAKSLTKRKVDYVVAGSNSLKMQAKAHDLKKTILTETEFLTLLEQDL